MERSFEHIVEVGVGCDYSQTDGRVERNGATKKEAEEAAERWW